jgi:Zn-finger nucleic acid-binding protein
MKCPVCSDATLVMSDRQGVEIDYCPQCRGVWLDRGELDKILERSRAESPAPAAAPAPAPAPAPTYAEQRGERPRYEEPRYQEPRYDSRYDPRYSSKKKRKNMLEELFDF